MADVQVFGNFIGGEWVPARSGGTFENRNPANSDDLIGRFAASSSEDVAAAVSAAAEAFPAWRGMSPIARANILYKASEILAARVNEIGAELTREEGKTLKEGIGETTRGMQILRYFAGEAAFTAAIDEAAADAEKWKQLAYQSEAPREAAE